MCTSLARNMDAINTAELWLRPSPAFPPLSFRWTRTQQGSSAGQVCRSGQKEPKTGLVAAYRPCRNSEDKKAERQKKQMMVWAQHSHYFQKQGIFHSPRMLFTRHLVAQLKQWRATGNEIILFIDVNDDLYQSDLAEELQGNGLLMSEQVLQSTGQEAPFSHQTGKITISSTYAAPGIVCRDSYVKPSWVWCG